MQITVSGPEGGRDVDVSLGPEVMPADVVAAVLQTGGEPGGDAALTLDGSPVPGTASVGDAGLVAGSVLSTGALPAAPAAARIAILAGGGAGATAPLPAGTHRLSRGRGGRGSDGVILQVSAPGTVRVSAAGGSWRSWAPGCVLALGGTVLGVLPAEEALPSRRLLPGRRGTVPFNRPPRQMPASVTAPVTLPAPPEPPPTTSRLGVAALVVPLLLAGAMALLYDPRFALFGLLGPVMLAGNWLEDRRRRRRHTRSCAVAEADAVETLRRELRRARSAEAVRRRRHLPTVPELAYRARGAPGMWERLPGHPDFLCLVAGYGPVPWLPPLDGDPEAASPPVRAVLAAGALPAAPVPLELGAGQVLGVTGARTDTLALARGLVVQAVTLHGPAHLQLAVVTDHPGDWDWVKWAPHTLARSSSGRRLLAAGPADEATVTGLLLPTSPPPGLHGADPSRPTDAITLLVVDVDDLSLPDHTAVRHLLGGRGAAVAGLVLGRERAHLPSTCTAVAEAATGTVRLDGDALAVVGATEQAATALTRRLARWDDPDRPDDGAELPTSVPLLEVLGMPAPTPDQVVQRWKFPGGSAAPIGVTDAGELLVDLLSDGPHGLLAGTTGSGKSELLRTLVASLASGTDPEHLAFVLIDYKGGSAFDACAGLPHIAGMVTDLDDSLAERALRCLEAELRHREQRLREAGVDDLRLFDPGPGDDPLPRMLIVIDEFAALAKELPDFMDALVDIAARGRSLGVHLLLATQRPAGVIRDNVRANTNLRIALRVQDAGDSTDVIGDSRAASLARSQPGRGYLRLGPGEVVAFQAAIVTGRSGGSGGGNVIARPFTFGAEPPAPPPVAGDISDGPTDLALLVAAITAAARRAGMRPVRRPWPDPLPDRLAAGALPAASPPVEGAVALGLADEPEEQRQSVYWWDPRQGSTILYGVAGSGTTTALATLALGLAASRPPDDLHLYVLDCDCGGLAPLVHLPHTGAVVGPHQRDRQRHLLRMLTAEIDSRLAGAGRHRGDPTVVLLVDGYHGFTAAHDGIDDQVYKDALNRIITDGAGVGIVAAVSVSRYSAVPAAVTGAVESKLLFRTADPTAATMLGVRSLPADMPPGRCVDTTTGRVVQVAVPHPDGISAAVSVVAATWPGGRGGPLPVEELPAAVKVPDVVAWLHLDDDGWRLPAGIGDERLAPVGWRLGEGDHVLVAGEPRSGRSTLLAALATMVAERHPAATVLGIAPRRSPLREVPGLTRLVTDPGGIEAAVADLLGIEGPRLVLVDDADDLDDGDGALTRLAAQRHPDVHVVAAARRDVKGRYGHWSRELCRSRQGLWLKPSDGVDGDLWSTPLPRRVPLPMPPGRGYLVTEGTVEVVQAVM